MFQFRRFPTYTYLIQCTLIRYCRIGFPHSEISGSMRMCRSPKLIAACHVLRRLLMPRHSPCALISLTYYYWSSNSCSRIMQAPYQVNFRNCNCFTLRLKVPQLKFIQSCDFRRASLLPCLSFNLSSVQFSRCKFRCRGMVENSGIEPLTS